MGNEIENIRKDLIDLDIEEMKINRELYNLQLEINAKLPKEKKVRLKKNYKEIAGKKIHYLEEKKKNLLEKGNVSGNNKTHNNNMINNAAIETSDVKNEEVKNNGEIKLNLITNSNNFTSGKNSSKKFSDKLNNNKKEMISSSESDNYVNVKTIYTRKNPLNKIKKEEIKNNEQEDIKNNNNQKDNKNTNNNISNQKEDLKYNNNDDEDKKYDNFRYLDKNNNDSEANDANDANDDLDENLNINQYKRKFFDKLSSLCPRSNVNKSMDNKNSSVVEELEVVGLSQNEILKEKLSEFFVGTSVASSNNKQNNCSSLHNNYNNVRPKSEISGMNRQLISSSKSNNTENENDGNDGATNSINYKNNININNGESQEFVNRQNNNNFESGENKEKFETEETINKETGNNSDDKYKEQNEQNNENNVNAKRLLRNNRNKSYFILEGSSSLDN
jgi:hypothetical protein